MLLSHKVTIFVNLEKKFPIRLKSQNLLDTIYADQMLDAFKEVSAQLKK